MQLALDEGQFRVAQLLVSIIGFGAVLTTLILGFKQYRRAEQWRKGEFIAKEIRDFHADPSARNTMLMMDWGRRRINIFQLPGTSDKDGERITRGIQWRALLPGALKQKYPEYRSPDLQTGEVGGDVDDYADLFTPLEAAIRDSYDVFFRYLERFSNMIELELIEAEEIEPYLRYWVNAVVSNEYAWIDSTWRSALLTYINFYKYDGVIHLFKLVGKDITPDGDAFKEAMAEMKKLSLHPDKQKGPPKVDRVKLAERLLKALGRTPEAGQLQDSAGPAANG